MRARWLVGAWAILVAVRCSPFSSDEPGPAPADADASASSPDAASTVPDPEDEPIELEDAGALPDAGCGPDASLEESFDDADLSAAGYNVVTDGNGTLGRDTSRGAPAPSLHVKVGADDRARAYVRRTFCGTAAPLECELSLKTDALTGGQAAFFELRGKSGGVPTIVRIKTNELQWSATDAGVLRAAIPVGTTTQSAFTMMRLTVNPGGSSVVLVDQQASVPAGLDTVDELRTGIMYLNRASGATTSAADLLVDEIRCSKPRPK